MCRDMCKISDTSDTESLLNNTYYLADIFIQSDWYIFVPISADKITQYTGKIFQ